MRIKLKSVILVHCQNTVSVQGGTSVPEKAKTTSATQRCFKLQALNQDEVSSG